MQNPKEAIKQIQALTYGAYQASGQVAALIGASRPENMADALASLGLLAFSRSGEYLTLTPEGYRLLSSFDLHYQPPSTRPYSQSPALRVGAGNLMNAAGCAGFGHWGDAAYMVQYVCEAYPGFFMNNKLAHLHNLSSVFSERLDTPQVILFAGDSYRSVYEVLTRKTQSARNGKKGFADYSQAYKLPISRVSWRPEIPRDFRICSLVCRAQILRNNVFFCSSRRSAGKDG